MEQKHMEAVAEIRHILFDDYKLKAMSDLEDLDGETLAEIYGYLKCVQENYDLSEDAIEMLLEEIED